MHQTIHLSTNTAEITACIERYKDGHIRFDAHLHNGRRYICTVLISVPIDPYTSTPYFDLARPVEIINKYDESDYSWEEDSYLRRRIYFYFPTFDKDLKRLIDTARRQFI